MGRVSDRCRTSYREPLNDRISTFEVVGTSKINSCVLSKLTYLSI
jgi:hypothetical protein